MIVILSSAFGHMALEQPLPRYPSDGLADNKACPCGVGESNRNCDVPSDRSDPDRSSFISTYSPGETVTLRWREVIGHGGRWRVAFDIDGADMADFNSEILLDIPDPEGDVGNMGGNLWEVDVTLPTTPCDNCTLQLVQMMDGNTTDPVPDPIGRSSYYQCADIVIEGTPIDTDVPTDTDDTDIAAVVDPVDSEAGCGCRAAGGMGAVWGLVGGFVFVRSRR